ncbi:MAG: AAA family ATPase [Acidimicrobiales bacterium]
MTSDSAFAPVTSSRAGEPAPTLPATSSTASPEEFARVAEALATQIGRVIVGQTDLVRDVLICLVCGGHALLEGVPGLGKTLLLKTLAQAVSLDFSRVQCTPDLMPADIVGTQVLSDDGSGRRDFSFRPGPVFTNLLLADEINRATPKTQSALLEAMAERSVTVAGHTRALPQPFLVMATQNPVEMEGTYPLPEAQVDRFLLKCLVLAPTAAELVSIVERTTGAAQPAVSAVASADDLLAMGELVRLVPAASHVARHAVDLIVATRPNEDGAPDAVARYVRFGASPRGAQALMLAAKATALLAGRPNVACEDIRAVAPAALRHRLVLGYEAVVDRVDADSIIAAVLDHVPPPTSGLKGAP